MRCGGFEIPGCVKGGRDSWLVGYVVKMRTGGGDSFKLSRLTLLTNEGQV